MRATAIDIGLVMVGPDTPAGRIRHAYRRLLAVHGNAVGARKGAEVAVERPVFLHDDDDVADLMDSRERVNRRAPTWRSPIVRASGRLGRRGALVGAASRLWR